MKLTKRGINMKNVSIDEIYTKFKDNLIYYQKLYAAVANFKYFDFLAEELADLDLTDFEFDFGLNGEDYSPDDFNDAFSLPDGDKPEICQMTFTLHEKQKQLIEYALSIVKEDITETFGNKNINGNALYEVIKEWAEQRK